MTISIQYVSDIHLEHHDKKNEGYLIPSMFVKPTAPYLALCGDIGNPELEAYTAFLSWCSKSWNHIFLIAGNHEFYKYRSGTPSDIPTRTQTIREIVSRYSNITFLDCDSFFFPEHNLRILGCTLWSDTSVGDESLIMKYMNDTRNIFIKGTDPFLPSLMTEMHFKQKAWLLQEIEDAGTRKESVLVLTHYLPSYKLIAEKYADNPMNMCFASNCEDLMRVPVKAWICGHSHTGVMLRINDVECRMNPYGYPGEKVETRNATAVLTLDTV
jgi:hypothetical protein